MRHVEIVQHKRRLTRQKWVGIFVADNEEPLTRTTDRYRDLADLNEMLAKYFPDWRITTR